MKKLPLLIVTVAAVACAGIQTPTTEDVRREATCATIHEFYDQAQDELIDRGLCDDAPNVESCAPHKLLVDIKILKLSAAKCTTKKETQ